MTPSDDQTAPTADSTPPDGGEAEDIPFMQRFLDNHFLLLFLGVAIPSVFYVIW